MGSMGTEYMRTLVHAHFRSRLRLLEMSGDRMPPIPSLHVESETRGGFLSAVVWGCFNFLTPLMYRVTALPSVIPPNSVSECPRHTSTTITKIQDSGRRGEARKLRRAFLSILSCVPLSLLTSDCPNSVLLVGVGTYTPSCPLPLPPSRGLSLGAPSRPLSPRHSCAIHARARLQTPQGTPSFTVGPYAAEYQEVERRAMCLRVFLPKFCALRVTVVPSVNPLIIPRLIPSRVWTVSSGSPIHLPFVTRSYASSSEDPPHEHRGAPADGDFQVGLVGGDGLALGKDGGGVDIALDDMSSGVVSSHKETGGRSRIQWRDEGLRWLADDSQARVEGILAGRLVGADTEGSVRPLGIAPGLFVEQRKRVAGAKGKQMALAACDINTSQNLSQPGKGF
ncbi:hypothetical protein C8F01DRAFT_1089787 [Mycena amicta]|nr:hypothetical protein C8F01DRAFT_1089787 [Mycena amicta]